MENSFEGLGIMDQVAQALQEIGYTKPTQIQKEGISAVLNGKDLVACAQTGTGKSAAFCVPIIQQIMKAKQAEGHIGIRALILVPTRELAVQIDTALGAYGRYTNVAHTAIFGGIPRKVQVDYLGRGIDILVATTGRLLDMVERGYVNLEKVDTLVLDEADMMLSLGFWDDVRKIVEMLPTQRQTLLFSATMPSEIIDFSQKILKNPLNIKVTPKEQTATNVSQKVYWVERQDKQQLLLHLLKNTEIESAFIFVATRQGADKVAETLRSEGFKSEALHSERTQKERNEALERFKNREIILLVATDIVARGVDVEQVSHVFNIDLPQENESYIHRIGRTGRAGHQGSSITFCEPSQMAKLKNLEQLIKKKIEVEQVHPFMNMAVRRKLFETEAELEKQQKSKHIKSKKRTKK